MLKVIWARSRVVYPGGTARKAKIIIRDTPVTRSGLMTGILVAAMTRLRLRRFMELMPMAAVTPRTVAHREDRKAMDRVTLRASMMFLSLSRAAYQSSVNPVQLPMVRDSLKEYTISTRMGA